MAKLGSDRRPQRPELGGDVIGLGRAVPEYLAELDLVPLANSLHRHDDRFVAFEMTGDAPGDHPPEKTTH